MNFERFPVDKADFDGPVLVTGAGGCLGSWALAILTRAGVPAVAFDLSDDRRRPLLLMSEEEIASIPWLSGDIADTEAVADAVARHDVRAIIHLAAL
jgi:nucleoside-diphosphate-sugar epimerase